MTATGEYFKKKIIEILNLKKDGSCYQAQLHVKYYIDLTDVDSSMFTRNLINSLCEMKRIVFDDIDKKITEIENL